MAYNPINFGTTDNDDTGDFPKPAAIKINGMFVELYRLLGPVTTPEEYGAVGDGTTNDTTAFNNALASGRAVFLSNKRYSVGDVVMPDYGRMFGFGVPAYAGDTVAYLVLGGVKCPLLVARTGAACILNVDNKQRWSIEDIIMHGNGVTAVRGLSAGGKLAYMKNIIILNCDVGFGGYGSSDVSSIYQCYSVVCGQCNTGMQAMVDSLIDGGAMAGGSGWAVDFGPGSNSNNFIGVRIEWHGGGGYKFYQCGDNQVVGGLIDRCGAAGLQAEDLSSPLIISGVDFRRNGRNSTTDGTISCHMSFINNTNSKARIIISGVSTQIGPDDGGGGNITPRVSINWSGTNSYVTMSGVDLSGFVTSVYNGSAPAGLVSAGVRLS